MDYHSLIEKIVSELKFKGKIKDGIIGSTRLKSLIEGKLHSNTNNATVYSCIHMFVRMNAHPPPSHTHTPCI